MEKIIDDLFEYNYEIFTNQEKLQEFDKKYIYLRSIIEIDRINLEYLNKLIGICFLRNYYERSNNDIINKIVSLPNFIFRPFISKHFVYALPEHLVNYKNKYEIEFISSVLKYVTFKWFCETINDQILDLSDNLLIQFMGCNSLSLYNNKYVSDVVNHNISDNNIINDQITNLLITKNFFDEYSNMVKCGKITPTEEHLNLLCSRSDSTISQIKFMLEHKLSPTNKSFNSLMENHNYNFENVIDLFINFGFNLTLKEVEEITFRKIIIPDFYKYDIVPSREIFDFCICENFYPDYFKNFELTEKDIEELFLYISNINGLIIFLKDRKIFLNVKCLENACKLKNNLDVIRYIIEEHGIIPNTRCLDNANDIKSNKDVIEYITSNIKV
jgi:hypothetical protein